MVWSIQQATEWLDGHRSFESSGRFEHKPTSAGVRAILDALGNPERGYKVIHITGTNGKGSVTRIASELVSALGYRVGSFVSPHLHRLNERILIGNSPVTDELLASELFLIAGMEEKLGLNLSWFEVLTVAAFSLFYAEGVEVAVVEVGIGGTWDSTNVVEADVAVVASVGHDHLELLGPTLGDVAADKAGIIKEGSVGIIGEVDESLRTIFERRPNAGLLFVGQQR